MALRTLYVDMNSFFASVEQHLNPRIRGRPVAITAVDATSGACVAASYEAKAFGVKTGTRVVDARRMCPGIVFLPSRHRLYVRYNVAVGKILDRFAELDRVRSVDEFQLVLSGDATTPEGAAALVTKMKAAVAREIGPCLRFSAGCGPNHLLAKIAGKLEKPDGFQWLDTVNMPDAIAHLSLSDLPGISSRMAYRLNDTGIYDIPTLYSLSPTRARKVWRSVEGERFVLMLQGVPLDLQPHQRGGIGNSKVLAPEYRHPIKAYYVGRWLVEKAGAQLRREDYAAARFTLSIRLFNGGAWAQYIDGFPSCDTAHFLRLHRQLWQRFWRHGRPGNLKSISVHLGKIVPMSHRQGDLFTPLAPATPSRGEKVSAALDHINARFGAGTIRYGINTPHPGFFERG